MIKITKCVTPSGVCLFYVKTTEYQKKNSLYDTFVYILIEKYFGFSKLFFIPQKKSCLLSLQLSFSMKKHLT